MSHFATSLKTLRQKENFSMQVLSDRAGVSKSMISKIERNEVQPTIDVASRLAKALKTTLSEMLHQPQSKQIVFLPKSEQAIWEDVQGVKRRNISPVFEGLKTEWLLFEIPASSTPLQTIPAQTPGVEKYIFIISGKLEIQVDEQVFKMEKDDSLYFDAAYRHELRNIGKDNLIFYVVVKHP